MKFTIVALVLAVCLVQSTEAWWGGMYGMGMGWGGLYGMGMGMYGMGMWGKRDTTETKPIDAMPTMNRTECIYNKKESTITCIGLAELVECKTNLRWDGEEIKKEFMMYGIAKSETTPRSYKLLPRTMTNSAWLDNTYKVDGVKDRKVSLFNSESLGHLGLRVIDEECFNKLDALFTMSQRNEKVFVKTEDSTEMTANIVADLMVSHISKKELSKRHYGYGGYRGGYGGYRGGYGGYGGYGGGYGGFRGGYGGYRGGWRG
jgi:hypothetical protein